jgi:hypothetical protein
MKKKQKSKAAKRAAAAPPRTRSLAPITSDELLESLRMRLPVVGFKEDPALPGSFSFTTTSGIRIDLVYDPDSKTAPIVIGVLEHNLLREIHIKRKLGLPRVKHEIMRLERATARVLLGQSPYVGTAVKKYKAAADEWRATNVKKVASTVVPKKEKLPLPDHMKVAKFQQHCKKCGKEVGDLDSTISDELNAGIICNECDEANKKQKALLTPVTESVTKEAAPAKKTAKQKKTAKPVAPPAEEEEKTV